MVKIADVKTAMLLRIGKKKKMNCKFNSFKKR